MRTVRLWLIGAAAAFAVVGATSNTLSAQAHAGAWGEIGLGGGALVMSCDGCAEEGTYGAPYGGIAGGFTVSQQLLVGGRISGWKRGSSDDAGIRFTGTARWYPSSTKSWFVVGDVGYVAFRGVRAGGATESGGGLTVGLGAGLDIALGASTAVTPVISVSYDAIGSTSLVGAPMRSGLNTLLVSVGLALTLF